MDENKENQTPESGQQQGELDWVQQYNLDQEREEQELQQALAQSLQEHVRPERDCVAFKHICSSIVFIFQHSGDTLMHLNGKSAYFQLLKREWLEPIRRDATFTSL